MRRPQTAIERDAAAELRAENEQLREALTHMLRVFTPRTGEPGPDMYVETVAWTHAEAVLHRLRDLRRDYDAAGDELAELRAAICEWVTSKALVDAELARDDPPEQLTEKLQRLAEAERVLRRLTGIEEDEQ